MQCYFHTYDVNGNTSELINSGGGISAHYQYDPFGKEIMSSGPWASANVYRFSTKSLDITVALNYYGFRYYNFDSGRWLNRDYIGEFGGKNLYGFAKNGAINNIDIMGKRCCLITYHATKKVSLTGHSALKCENTYISIFPDTWIPSPIPGFGSGHHTEGDDKRDYGDVKGNPNWNTETGTYVTTEGVQVDVLCSDCLTDEKVKAPPAGCDWWLGKTCADYTLDGIIAGVDQEEIECPCGYSATDLLDADFIQTPLSTAEKLKILEENNCKRWKCERNFWGWLTGKPKVPQ